MKGFIEVTDYDGGMKVLLPVSKITAIVCDDDGSVFVELGLNNKGDSSGLLVTESYDEIKEKSNKRSVAQMATLIQGRDGKRSFY